MMVDVTESGGAEGDPTANTIAGEIELAQAADGGILGDPIGFVREAVGDVLLLHADGTSEFATAGAPVFLDDLVSTGPGGAVELLLIDDTTFSLGANGQMRLDKLIFDPSGGSNGLDATVVKGSFVFITGKIGSSEGEGVQIDTPAGSIGIRGTAGAGAQDPQTGAWIITLFRDPDGTLSRFTFTNPAGARLLDQEFETTQIAGRQIAPSQTFVLSPTEAAALFGDALQVLQEQFPELNREQRGELENVIPAAGEQFPVEQAQALPDFVALADLYGLEALAGNLAELLAAGGFGSGSSGGQGNPNAAPGGTTTDTFLPVPVNNLPAPPVDNDPEPNIVAEGAAAGTVVGITALAKDPRFTGPITYSLLDDGGGAFAIDPVTGVVTVADGSLLDFESGGAFTVIVQASDGVHSSVAPLTITLQNVNEPPSEIALSNAAVAENAPGAVVGTLSAVDPDAGDDLAFTVSDDRFEVVGGRLKLKEGVSLDHEAAGAVTIDVTVTDGEGLTLTETFVIEVTDANDPPAADDDKTIAVAEDSGDTSLAIAAPTDVDGDALTITVTGVPDAAVGSIYLANGTTLVKNGMPLTSAELSSLLFRPAPDANGAAGSFSYTVVDGGGESDDQTVTLEVTPVNDPPRADADKTITVFEDSGNSALGISAPTDIDGGALTITVTAVPNAAIGAVYLSDGTTQVADGMPLTVAELTGLLFRPAADANGAAGLFSYSVADGNGGIDSQTVTLDVTPVNDAPVADGDKTVTIAEDSGNSALGISAPTDIDGDPLVITVTSVPDVAVGSVYLADGTTLVINGMPLTSAELTGLVFRPAADASGAAGTFSFAVDDGNGGTDNQTIALNVTPVNDAPVADFDRTVTVVEDSVDAALGISAPTDAEGDALAITVNGVPDAAVGSVYLADGATLVALGMVLTSAQLTGLLFRPVADANGPAGTFSYSVADGNGGIDGQTITLAVAPVNDPPQADADKSVTVAEDSAATALGISAPTDIDGDVLTITVTGVPDAALGAVYLSDGTTPVTNGMPMTSAELTGLVFRPAADANGPAGTFSYSVSDGKGGFDSQTVTFEVTPVNDRPVADPDKRVTVAEDSAATALGIAAPGDVDGDVLTITVTGVPDAAVGSVSLADGTTLVANGMALTIDQLTGLLFRPEANANGTAGSFSYSVNDGNGGIDGQTVTFEVSPVNDPPAADADKTVTVAEDSSATPLEIAAPTDIDGDQLAIKVTAVPDPKIGAVYLADGQTRVMSGMELTVDQLTSLLFRPTPDANGAAGSFGYTVDDGQGGSDSQVVTLQVSPVNDPPVAEDDKAITVAEDSGLTPLKIAAPFDVDGDKLAIKVTSVPDEKIGSVFLADGKTPVTAGMELTPDQLTGLVFRPAPNANGAAGSFGYTVDDGQGGSDSQAVKFEVTPVNDPPVAEDDKTVTVAEDSGLTPLKIAAPADVDGDKLAIKVTGVPDGKIGSVFLADGKTPVAAGMELTPDQLTGLLFRPAPNASGAASGLSYTVDDGRGGSDSQTVSLIVTPVNDAPAATNDNYVIAEDGTLTVLVPGVLANDADIDGDKLTAVLADGPLHGEVVLNPDGSFTYTPDADFAGPDSFTYRAGDGATQSGVAMVTVDVTPVNDAPNAVADAYGVTQGGTLEVGAINGVLANDKDAEGDVLQVTLASGPSHGALQLNADGSFSYTPSADFDGQDSFIYKLDDGHGGADTATVTIAVADVQPVAVDDLVTVADQVQRTVDLVIVLDRSGSMSGNPGVAGFSTRLELARAAIAALFEAYDSVADLNIQIVDFAGEAASSGWLGTTEAANAYLAGLIVGGGTNYAAAISATMAAYENAPPADTTEIYFLSDGVPSPGTSLAEAGLVAAWESFLADPANHIDQAFAVGIGTGIASNDPDLADVAFPNGDPENPVVVTDEGRLIGTLLGTITNTVSGNVLANDDFGPDGKGNGGAGLLTLIVDGVTYTYDGSQIVSDDPFIPAIAGAKLVVFRGDHGTLEFHFDDGDYIFTAPDVQSAQVEEFLYTIVDGDGSTDSGVLHFDILDSGIIVSDPSTVIGTDSGKTGADTLAGAPGAVDDIMSGGKGDDVIAGGGGNDHIQGGAGNDGLLGGAGADILLGGAGGDTLDGGAGADGLFGETGNDRITVGAGDRASGGDGNDLIVLADSGGFAAVDGGGALAVDLASDSGDVLAFNGELALGQLAPDRVDGIETVSMADASGGAGLDQLMISATDIIDLGSGRFDPAGNLPAAAAIRVDGDQDDVLALLGGGWSKAGTPASNLPPGYDLYLHDSPTPGIDADAYALVQSAITVTL